MTNTKIEIGTDNKKLIELAERILELPEHERLAVVDILRMNMCLECGGRYGCQCWNDD